MQNQAQKTKYRKISFEWLCAKVQERCQTKGIRAFQYNTLNCPNFVCCTLNQNSTIVQQYRQCRILNLLRQSTQCDIGLSQHEENRIKIAYHEFRYFWALHCNFRGLTSCWWTLQRCWRSIIKNFAFFVAWFVSLLSDNSLLWCCIFAG